LTPGEYLKSQGIDLELMTTLAVVDGCLRQIDIVHLMEQYAKVENHIKQKGGLLGESLNSEVDWNSGKGVFQNYYPKQNGFKKD